MITFKHKGNFDKTTKFLNTVSKGTYINKVLSKYGNQGVEALRNATPVESGVTANSWSYSIESNKDTVTISWNNTNINDGVNIAIILQYGHGTRNGGYVAGRDYINPAIKPIFDKIAEEVWKEVTSA